jgi:AcrR family transcriptional regulator
MLSTPPDHPARLTPAGPAASAGSRERVVAAARREFAALGFAGASVDRIAAAARLNKAMIYYHFRSKAALYRAILRDMFGAAGARIREVAASSLSPEEKVRQFINAIATEAEARPHFPPIWFREIADGGKHLDDETLVEITGIVRALAGFIGEGVHQGVFKRTDPLLVHAGIVAPLLLFFASAPLRARMAEVGLSATSFHDRDAVVAHIENVTLGILEGRVGAGRRKREATEVTKVRLKPDITRVRVKPDTTRVRLTPDTTRGPDATKRRRVSRRTGKR